MLDLVLVVLLVQPVVLELVVLAVETVLETEELEVHVDKVVPEVLVEPEELLVKLVLVVVQVQLVIQEHLVVLEQTETKLMVLAVLVVAAVLAVLVAHQVVQLVTIFIIEHQLHSITQAQLPEINYEIYSKRQNNY